MKLSFPPEIASALKGKKIFCSLSGGADSLALLLFLDLHKEAAGFALEAVHFEHGFRGRASIADAAFCKRLCMQRNIPCALFRIDVPHNRQRGEGDEEAARRVRLEYWRKIVFNPEHSLVALGHHSGDRIENVFLRLFRGSNSTGLSSMRFIQKIGRITFIRPFLDYAKQDLEQFLREQNVMEWRHDSTNDTSVYKRNLIRNELLPEIRKEFPFAEAGILQSIRTLAEDSAFLEESADRAYRNLRTDSSTTDWRALPAALLPRVLRRFLTEATGSDIIPDSNLIERLSATLALPDSGRRRIIPLSGQKDYRLALKSGKVACEKRLPAQFLPDVLWDYRQEHRQEYGTTVLTAEFITPEEMLFTTDKSAAFFDASKLDDRLTVSTWKTGDRMVPFGKQNPVSLKKLFSDAGVPMEQKRSLPVVRNSSGTILWIPFVKNSAFAPVTPETEQVLKLLAVHSPE